MRLEFSFAKTADADTISTLVNSAYRGESSKVGWTTEAHFLDGQRTEPAEIKAIIDGKNSYILLGRQESQILGTCELVVDDKAGELYFGMFTIKPTLQNQGLGKEFLSHVETLAKNWKLKKIKMTVITVRTELIEYYQRRGFRLTDELISFPKEERFGIPKIQDLKLVYLIKDIDE